MCIEEKKEIKKRNWEKKESETFYCSEGKNVRVKKFPAGAFIYIHSLAWALHNFQR
jgi:hypothetical protein